MERWLNTRAALIAAWSFVGILLLGVAAFALFLLWPSGGKAREADAALREVTVAAQPSATATPGRSGFSGTVERIEGQALVLKLSNGQTVRVLVRTGARMGRFSRAEASDIQANDTVQVLAARQSDGRLRALVIRIQPVDLPIVLPGSDQRGGNSPDSQYVSATVISVQPEEMRVRTSRGEQALEMGATVRVTRFVPIALTEIHTGQRVTVDGERLVDGTFAASYVQTFE